MSNKSVYDIVQEKKKLYQTEGNKYSDFPIGSKVKVITVCQDFNFFHGNETGIVTDNTGKYLGIKVKFDIVRKFDNGSIQKDFNFEPSDLVLLEKTEVKCVNPDCDGEVITKKLSQMVLDHKCSKCQVNWLTCE